MRKFRGKREVFRLCNFPEFQQEYGVYHFVQSMPCVLRGKGKNVKMNTLNVYRKIRQSRRKKGSEV